MEPFHTCTAIAVPLRRSNVDTDQIIPSKFMKRITRTGYDDGLFAQWRTKPDFVLNTAPFDRGRILIAGPEFGTGSSREHAVWALWDYGFRAVLSARFADIFRSNAGKAGLLCAEVPQPDIERLWKSVEAEPFRPVTVDLRTCTITTEHYAIPFDIDDYTRWRLLEGLGDIDLTLRHSDAIDVYERSRPRWKPTTSGGPEVTDLPVVGPSET